MVASSLLNWIQITSSVSLEQQWKSLLSSFNWGRCLSLPYLQVVQGSATTGRVVTQNLRLSVFLSYLSRIFPFSCALVSSDSVLWFFKTDLQLKAIKKKKKNNNKHSPSASLFSSADPLPVSACFQWLFSASGLVVVLFCSVWFLFFLPSVLIVNYGSLVL